jgi:signal transduction histidine kinase
VTNPHDELGQLASVFNQTLQRLENSFAELKRFTADASHELRTPLTALRAVGEVALSEDDHPAINSMLEEAERLQELIDSLLALARMEGGKTEVNFGTLEIGGLLEEVRDSLQILASEKKQTIRLLETLAIKATGDRVLLRQALFNIVHNAIRYAPAAALISLQASLKDDKAVITVSDTGPGISPEHHTKIFERFYRVDRARSRSEGGHGLGLAIAKWAVERQGGHIELESAPGHGATFRIYLRP